MSKLVEIAERCEQADGPTREIDIEIGRAIHPDLEWYKETVRWNADQYTASLDAAVSLLPAGLRWLCGSGDGTVGRPPWANVGMPGAADVHVTARTLPLAICAAALRARQLSDTHRPEGNSDV